MFLVDLLTGPSLLLDRLLDPLAMFGDVSVFFGRG